MKYLKNVEQFNEEFLGLGKSNEEKYEDLKNEIKTEFSDDAMKTMDRDLAMETMASYITKLNKIEKLNDFKSTEDGKRFIKIFRGLNTMKEIKTKI